MKKLIVIAIAVLLLSYTFSTVFVNLGSSSVPVENHPKGIDDNVKDVEVAMDEPLEDLGATHHSYWNLGDSAIWLRYGSGYASQFTYFTLSYIGTSVEIWVQNNINFPTGDPRNGPGGVPGPTKPTYAMLQYYANQFETNILPKETAYFGSPLFHDGSNAQTPVYYPTLPGMTADYYYEPTGRTVILVSNIRDANYYNPNYPYYVIGSFVSSYTDFYFDRNLVNIDAVSWYHGLGSTSMNWGNHYYYPTNIMHNHNVLSPYAYDSTLAHEWQHLLHYELCPGDATFMNEGCSMYSEYLCDYGIDPDYFNSYFYTPDNSLTLWGDQGDINILADYGVAALWCMYLSDHYGASFLSYYFQTVGGGGVDGINTALANLGYSKTFLEVYHDWKLANLIRADAPGNGLYNYHNIDLNDPSIIPVRIVDYESGSFDWKRASTTFGTTRTILGYDTGISLLPQFGTDYISLSEIGLGTVYFDGDLTGVMPPSTGDWIYDSTNGWWYAGDTDLLNTMIGGSVTVGATSTLTLVTAWDLESYWDFGFIQVSTDNGQTWTSLTDNEGYATFDHDPAAHPDVVANLPGLTDINSNWWFGSYDGTSPPGMGDWDTLTFDLSAYNGQTVLIGFRCVTDWATVYLGWFIQSAEVDGTPLNLQLIPLPAAPATFQVDWVLWDEAAYTAVFPLDGLNNGTITPLPPTGMSVILVVTSTADGAVNSPTIVGLEDYQFKVLATTEVGGTWAPQTLFATKDAPNIWLGLVPALVLTTASIAFLRHKKKKHE